MTDDKDRDVQGEDTTETSNDANGASDQRGFASMDGQKQRQIASKGGKAAHEKGTAHEFTPDEARAAGRKGGVVVSQNRSHMAEIGRKGGERVSRDRRHMAEIGRKGGEAVSGDRQHMAQIGRKGGESRGEGGVKTQPPRRSDVAPRPEAPQNAPRTEAEQIKKAG